MQCKHCTQPTFAYRIKYKLLNSHSTLQICHDFLVLKFMCFPESHKDRFKKIKALLNYVLEPYLNSNFHFKFFMLYNNGILTGLSFLTIFGLIDSNILGELASDYTFLKYGGNLQMYFLCVHACTLVYNIPQKFSLLPLCLLSINC